MRSLRHGGIEIAHRVFLPSDEAERREALARVVAWTRQSAAQELVLVVTADQLHQLDAVLEELRSVPLPIRLLPDARLSQLVLQPSRRVGAFALVDITREPLSASERWVKRALDIAVAGLALAATAPLLTLVMAAIKLDSPGPVLFRQTRRGFNGRDFKILKLRTMSVLEDGEGIAQATKRDPRVTRIGAWLRRTSIDELPQLWNVLRGEMSVVGPRPHAVAHDNYYDTLIENYAFRHHVKPGLTGWAQVRGHRGETPKVSMMAARVEHDIWYINNWSLLLDIRILFLTVTRLLDRTAY
jgi:Undecaprenyl-phosphate glucose phosphotransferase